jgi:NAD(P)-dependent dehydrogenase (short-subunit alcohol dehydrogenase family)
MPTPPGRRERIPLLLAAAFVDPGHVASARLRAHGGAVDTRLCDVSNRKAVEASFAATLAEFGRIDACFANAGIGGGGRKSFVDRSEEEWRRMFAVNLDSVFHLFQRDLTRRRNCSMPPARAKAPAAWRKWRRCVAPHRKQFATEPVMSPAGLCGERCFDLTLLASTCIRTRPERTLLISRSVVTSIRLK